ncbi:MAG: FixH family protein [Calditrichia bacterium]
MIKKSLYWPIGITLFLCCFIGFLASVVFIATSTPVNLEDRDYYQSAINFQERMDQQQRAADSEQLTWSYDSELQQGTISCSGEAVIGKVSFRRPSNEYQDFTAPLNLEANGQSTFDLREAASGLWRVEIEWQTTDGATFFQSERLVINKSAEQS